MSFSLLSTAHVGNKYISTCIHDVSTCYATLRGRVFAIREGVEFA